MPLLDVPSFDCNCDCNPGSGSSSEEALRSLRGSFRGLRLVWEEGEGWTLVMAPVEGSRVTFTSELPVVLGTLEEGIASAPRCPSLATLFAFEILCSVPPVCAFSFEERPRRW